MTATTYPFARAKSIGWAYGEILTSAQMNIVDDNASQAADGAVWTDIARAKNWKTPVSTAQDVVAFLWCAASNRWFGVTDNAGNPVGFIFYEDQKESLSSASLQNGAGLTFEMRGTASDGAGTLLIGGTPGSGSTSKLRRSTNGGETWAVQAIGSADTAGVTALHWSTTNSLFVAALSDGTLYTSPTGAVWTVRTNPISTKPIVAFADNGTTIVGVTSTSSAVCISSTNATSWTSRTISATAVWLDVTYSSYLGAFYAISGSDVLSTSTDGTTWSTVTTTAHASAPFTDVSTIACIGRVLVVSADSSRLLASVDGLTWKKLMQSDGQPYVVSANGKQFILSDTATKVYQSVGLGL
jgi:hypothetical protein